MSECQCGKKMMEAQRVAILQQSLGGGLSTLLLGGAYGGGYVEGQYDGAVYKAHRPPVSKHDLTRTIEWQATDRMRPNQNVKLSSDQQFNQEWMQWFKRKLLGRKIGAKHIEPMPRRAQ